MRSKRLAARKAVAAGRADFARCGLLLELRDDLASDEVDRIDLLDIP
jgi:hypothetical protein